MTFLRSGGQAGDILVSTCETRLEAVDAFLQNSENGADQEGRAGQHHCGRDRRAVRDPAKAPASLGCLLGNQRGQTQSQPRVAVLLCLANSWHKLWHSQGSPL